MTARVAISGKVKAGAAGNTIGARRRRIKAGCSVGSLAGAIAIAAAASVSTGDFHERLTSRLPPDRLPRDAVVFTGQFDRVHKGLELLRHGRIDRLFISGVNPGAGMVTYRFATQFALDEDLVAALAEGRLILAPHARSTLENASEAACWFKTREPHEVLLITSGSHMPRASLALERALPDTRVWRLTVPDARGSEAQRRTELWKFSVVWWLGRAWPSAIASSTCSSSFGAGRRGQPLKASRAGQTVRGPHAVL